VNKEVKQLLIFIKYTPSLVIILVSVLIATWIYQEQEKEFEKEKEFIERKFIESEQIRIKDNINTIQYYIEQKKQKSEQILKKDIQNRINNAHDIATNIYNKNKDILSKDQIIKQIKTSLEMIRFNEGRGYFSIHSMKGINILHPINKAFENTSVLNRVDIKGNYPVKNAIEIAKTKNEGFFSWYYSKPGDKSKELKKIGIVKKFEPYDLIITTAEYQKDFENNLKKEILNDISRLIYKDNGFIFVLTYEGQMILHKSKAIVNHNILNEKKFSHVKQFFEKLILSKNKKEGTFITTTPIISENLNTTDKRISYIKKFDEWEWIIGTSFKLSELNKIIEKRRLVLEQKYTDYENSIFILGLIFTTVLLFTSFFVSNFLERKFLQYKRKQEEQVKKELDAKDKLLHIKEEFNSFFELSINLQIISSVEGKILQINNASKTMLGYEKEELINTIFLDLIHPEDLNRTIEEMQKLEKGEIVYFFENRYKHKNGTYINLAWSATTDITNKLIFATAQNITNAKKLEKESKEKERLLFQQSKLAAMGEMLGNIAHQWRQPLSTISTGATGIKLQKEMNILKDKDFNNTMDIINNSAQFLSQTIDDFRGFFDPRNNRVSEFLISETIDKTLKLISSQFTSKNIEIIHNSKDISLSSLENALIQTLLNVLNNSKDALLKIENQKKLIFIDAYSKENTLVIKVKDNAHGISENIIDRIFEPYFTTKHQSKGTGIGLYMSQDIVKSLLKGSISVQNETYTYEDQKYTGAVFTIEIPLI